MGKSGTSPDAMGCAVCSLFTIALYNLVNYQTSYNLTPRCSRRRQASTMLATNADCSLNGKTVSVMETANLARLRMQWVVQPIPCSPAVVSSSLRSGCETINILTTLGVGRHSQESSDQNVKTKCPGASEVLWKQKLQLRSRSCNADDACTHYSNLDL
jgi:hypothetical protein